MKWSVLLALLVLPLVNQSAASQCGQNQLDLMEVNRLDDLSDELFRARRREEACQNLQALVSLVQKLSQEAAECRNFVFQPFLDQKLTFFKNKIKTSGC